MKYLDDFEPGQVFEFQTEPLSAEQVMEFATEWDPQPMHIDPDFANAGIHGGLIASGFQTVLTVFQPVMHNVMTGIANIGGIGLNKVRWLRPLRPDQALDVRFEITAVTPSRSKPDRGVLTYEIEARNPEGDLIFTVEVPVMVQRRQGGAG